MLSLRTTATVLLCAAALCRSALAQYPGRIAKVEDKKPVLRSVAVLEWIGPPGKPTASRLVPVSVYDGEQLNDGNIYLPEPAPLAISNGTEYELQAAGKPIGLFDLLGEGKEDGVWEGFGAWKPLTAPEAAKAQEAFNTSSLMHGDADADDGKPVLKRKHPKGADSEDSSASAAQPAPASAEGSARVDPDRPTLHRARQSGEVAAGPSNAAPDPDRPRLKHGKPAGLDEVELPALRGFPAGMQQAVAVSDGSDHAEHPWKYSWANPDDEKKMKAALEAMARTALGLDPPPAPATKAGTRGRTPLVALAPPEPPALAGEQFRVFELAYGATATMVLTAATPPPPPPAKDDGNEPPPPTIRRGKPTSKATAELTAGPAASQPPAQKFVTLIAQPDLYGGLRVLYRKVTDTKHLEDAPRMILIDAVDALADNRGELLFELRGKNQRQFALFRVLRGSAEPLFATVAAE